MGIYNDLATQSVSITPSKPRVGLDRSSAEQLLQAAFELDPGVSTPYAARNESDQIDQLTGTPTAGDYTLTVVFPRLNISYTTAAIAYNATAATIEAALDTASPAAIGDGDIAVSESGSAGLSDGTCDFDCQNTAGNQPMTLTIDNTGVTGIGGVQTVTRTVTGQTDRKATMALYELNVVEGTLQDSGSTPSWTRPASNGQSRPRAGLIKDLGRQAVYEDGSDAALVALNALYQLPC